jgi:hypothetical protein
MELHGEGEHGVIWYVEHYCYSHVEWMLEMTGREQCRHTAVYAGHCSGICCI